jgi:hypothetical protein
MQNKTTTMIDADASHGGSDLTSLPAPSISADGRLVAFEAPDNGLVPNDRNRAFDVFIREPGSNTTELVSAHAPQLPSQTPNGESTIVRFASSSDGRWVAFSSDATDIIGNDTNDLRDVFVRDLVNGTATLVSVSTNGSAADGDSAEISISADGGYAVFSSGADNLVAGDNNNSRDVFLRDLRNGVTTLVSVSTNGVDSGNSASYTPTLSADARFVLFLSTARNLASATAKANSENLYLRDRQSGKTYALTTQGAAGATISASGQFVLVLNSMLAQGPALRLWDTQATTWVYSNSTSGIIAAGLSPDGSQVLYGTRNGLYGVDWKANTNQLISTLQPSSSDLRFSADSRYLVYAAKGVTQPNSPQIFIYDFRTGTNQLVSRNWQSGAAADGPADDPDISVDGRFIAYRSSADDLVPGGINGSFGIFLYDRLEGSTRLVSVNQSGTGTGNNLSLNPFFSGDGQAVFFESWASDLVTGDFNANADIFMFKIDSGNSFYVRAVNQGGIPWIYWTALPGKSYKVQFKNELNSGNWQDASEVPVIGGAQASWKDTLPIAGNRFYRVVSY